MSLSKLEEIRCPCGEAFEAELWNAINALEDPELKEALVGGEINVVCCPSCNQIFYAEHFILYQDPSSELLAFVYPSSFADKADYWEARMADDFQRAMEEIAPDEKLCYKPILLFGLDALVEIIHADDAEVDEVAIVEYLAQELGLSLISLHPSLARPRKLPKLLPRLPVKSGNIREEIIAGLKKVLHRNQHLEIYKRLLDSIESDKGWTLEKKLIKSSKRSKDSDR